ncbi:Uncharacterised protein [[Clostridium] sordellii]|uniref:hypothetical protein n=1 Tax=Paraclostridium sordellii TaxID=1505 RepID=UPI0005E9DF84|nr:hypothetical protein [Paeniclostridium sordellii]CEP50265.1 Uncharacterised protein [[Clostridium] sordellii] [Paeniclostridium sordellii]
MNIEVTVICTIVGAIIGYMSYQKKNQKDIEDDAAQKTLLATKLDYISKGVDDIRVDIKSQDRSIRDLTVRMVKCEESTKSAHHRLDELISKGDGTNEK